MFSYLEAKRFLRVPLESPRENLQIRSVSIDTRTLNSGDLFVALPGKQADGAQFIPAAFQKGASGAMVALSHKNAVQAELKKLGILPQNLIFVSNPQETMLRLCTAYRAMLSVKIIGVTGSVGKTTTKEFLFYLLKRKYSTLATAGNLNNHLGVPIMLSRLEASHQMAILEMGASHPGEIHFLSNMAKPSAGVLTPIGPAHLEGFGSLDKVYQTKLELVDALKVSDPIVVPEDQNLLAEIKKRKKEAISVGYSHQAGFQISDLVSADGLVSFKIQGHGPFCFPSCAPFLALNAGLAIAMARALGIPWEELPVRWDDVTFASGRFHETILSNGIRLIDDSYNANPISFQNAIEAFRNYPCRGKKILVFADMRELGIEEERFHRELGECIAKSGLDYALAYGKLTRASIETIEQKGTACKARYFASQDEIVEFLNAILVSGDVVLFKGSRSMRAEEVLAGIIKRAESTKT